MDNYLTIIKKNHYKNDLCKIHYTNEIEFNENIKVFFLIKIDNVNNIKQKVNNELKNKYKNEGENLYYNENIYDFINDVNTIVLNTDKKENTTNTNRLINNYCSMDMFLNNIFKYDETNEGINTNNTLNNVYNEYSMYCDNINKKKRSREYFTKNLKRYGYKTERKQLNSVKNRYIIKE